MADNKQHDTRTDRRPDCVTEDVYKRQSLDYLMNEKFVQFAASEPDEEYPFTVCGQTVLLCNACLLYTSSGSLFSDESRRRYSLFILRAYSPARRRNSAPASPAPTFETRLWT